MNDWLTFFLKEGLKAILLLGVLVGVAMASFRLFSRKWEQQKLSSELTVDYMKSYWGRLEALARRLGDTLTFNLRDEPLESRQGAFHNLVDFRLTLFRFYEEASGWLPGVDRILEQQTLKLQDALFATTRRFLSGRDVAWLNVEFLGDGQGHAPSRIFLELTDPPEERERRTRQGGGENLLHRAFASFETWIGEEEGRLCAEAGKTFKQYAERMNSLIKTVLPIY